jgi:hypothetical protein
MAANRADPLIIQDFLPNHFPGTRMLNLRVLVCLVQEQD